MLSLNVILMLAVCTAMAFILTASRVKGFGFLLKHASIVDVVFTVVLVVIFSGTLGGMLVAVMAGLFLSMILTGCRMVIKHGSILTGKVKDDEYDDKGNWVYNQAPYV